MTARATCRKLREVFRLHFEKKLSSRVIGKNCMLSPSTVQDYLARHAVAKLGWPLAPALDDDAALSELLFPHERHPKAVRPEPDWATVYLELRRKHVTKMLLWQEYRETHPEGYEYSQFCERYARWIPTISLTMRQEHIAGEKLFVDFSGDGLTLVDPRTGECFKGTRPTSTVSKAGTSLISRVRWGDVRPRRRAWLLRPDARRALATSLRAAAPRGRPAGTRWPRAPAALPLAPPWHASAAATAR